MLASEERENPTVAVEIVVPVYNEAAGLAASVERLHAYLDGDFPFSFQITIADNASTDGTWELAQALSRRFAHVKARHLDQKGRGPGAARGVVAERRDRPGVHGRRPVD